MTDTLELLETIGRDASLRHAPADALARILDEAQASEALRAAVASGDSATLEEEFGRNPNYVAQQPPQSTQTPYPDEREPAKKKPTPDEEEPEDVPARPKRPHG